GRRGAPTHGAPSRGVLAVRGAGRSGVGAHRSADRVRRGLRRARGTHRCDAGHGGSPPRPRPGAPVRRPDGPRRGGPADGLRLEGPHKRVVEVCPTRVRGTYGAVAYAAV